MTEEEIKQRAFAYLNIDGINELSIGFMLFAVGVLEWLQMSTPKTSFWNQWYAFALYFAVITSVMHHGGKALKKRITYPRSGFAEVRRDASQIRLLILVFLGTAVASSALVVAIRSHWDGMAAAAALIFAAALAGSYSHRMARTAAWKWIISLLMGTGSLMIAFAPQQLLTAPAAGSWITHLFPAPLVGACLYSLLLYGTLYTISGGITFATYIRSSQPA